MVNNFKSFNRYSYLLVGTFFFIFYIIVSIIVAIPFQFNCKIRLFNLLIFVQYAVFGLLLIFFQLIISAVDIFFNLHLFIRCKFYDFFKNDQFYYRMESKFKFNI